MDPKMTTIVYGIVAVMIGLFILDQMKKIGTD